MIFFTSDTHFGHKRIITDGGRAFATLEGHDEALIKNWNAIVGPKDTVYHLGDFSLCNRAHRVECFHALKGHKRFVEGNHDDGLQELVNAWEVITKSYDAMWLGRLHTFKMDNLRAELCHFPLEVWDRKHYGTFHLHGHSHDHCNTQPNWRRLDVGVDAAFRLLGAYRPFSWDEIKALMAKRMDWSSTDHHTPKRA